MADKKSLLYYEIDFCKGVSNKNFHNDYDKEGSSNMSLMQLSLL